MDVTVRPRSLSDQDWHRTTGALSDMDDRTRLLLIDQLCDGLSFDMPDTLADGLADAFAIAEEGTRGVFVPHYPAGALSLSVWQAFRAKRDALLAEFFATPMPERGDVGASFERAA